jgi:8-oxo-dGTP diphosphatase
MAKPQVQAAGGIVLRREQPPRVAVVRLRKRDEWVLPKGKLDDGETPRAAARREVLEETGHNVKVHEFLGTLVYEAGGRPKVVHYWSMEASGGQTRELMSDVRAVDWLPLNAAVERLSRDSERAFLETVGPLAISAHARRVKAEASVTREAASKAPAGRRGRVAVPIELSSIEAVSQPMQPEFVGEAGQSAISSGEMPAIEPLAKAGNGRRRSLGQRLRGWLGRALS